MTEHTEQATDALKRVREYVRQFDRLNDTGGKVHSVHTDPESDFGADLTSADLHLLIGAADGDVTDDDISRTNDALDRVCEYLRQFDRLNDTGGDIHSVHSDPETDWGMTLTSVDLHLLTEVLKRGSTSLGNSGQFSALFERFLDPKRSSIGGETPRTDDDSEALIRADAREFMRDRYGVRPQEGADLVAGEPDARSMGLSPSVYAQRHGRITRPADGDNAGKDA